MRNIFLSPCKIIRMDILLILFLETFEQMKKKEFLQKTHPLCSVLQENDPSWDCTFDHVQPHSCFHVQVERSSTDTTLPLNLFSLCSLLLLLTISSITKSSKTPTRMQEMVTSIFSPSLVPSPSSLCTTDLMRGGIVPASRGMALEAYQ